jgi:hypothetical protein
MIGVVKMLVEQTHIRVEVRGTLTTAELVSLKTLLQEVADDAVQAIQANFDKPSIPGDEL